jgi:hypothetical protein
VPDSDGPPKGPADEFERFLEHSTDAEINTWAARTFGGERYRVVVWLLTSVRRLQAEVAELKARKGRT